MYDGDANRLTLDAATGDRWAMSTRTDILISQDGGDTWDALDDEIPLVGKNWLAFAGERLLAGT